MKSLIKWRAKYKDNLVVQAITLILIWAVVVPLVLVVFRACEAAPETPLPVDESLTKIQL